MKNTPYTEGWHSRLRGESELNNPYYRDQYAYDMWLEGYLDRNEIESLINVKRPIEAVEK